MGYPTPTIGKTVHYRGREGRQAVRAAIVTCDVDTLDPAGVDAGDVPGLDSVQHVHLWVFTPSERGGFAEYNVARGDRDEDGVFPPGTWTWPRSF